MSSSVTNVPIDAQFGQKLNIEFLTLTQISCCNKAANEGDEAKFDNSVDALFAIIPKESRKRIEIIAEDPERGYIRDEEEAIYTYSCGHAMGTPENPIYRNKPGDWNYDPSLEQTKTVKEKVKRTVIDEETRKEKEIEEEIEREIITYGEPVLVSPRMVIVPKTDYQKFYKLILSELQDSGVTWKTETRDNYGKRIDPPPTPLLKEGVIVTRLIPTRISLHSGDILVPIPGDLNPDKEKVEVEILPITPSDIPPEESIEEDDE